MTMGFTRRVALALALVLLAFGLFVALLVRHVVVQVQDAGNQHLARGLAQHMVERWPALRTGDAGRADDGAREALLRMLGTVNPAVQVYLLDADGSVAHYIGQPGMVRTPRVDLAAVQRFLAGAPLPLRGTDPMGGSPRPFSAAMFAPMPGATRPPGYLYVVLQDAARAGPGAPPDWLGAVGIVLLAGLVALAAGAVLLWQLSLPLHRLAARMHGFDIDGARREPGAPAATAPEDEITAIASAFDRLAARVSQQARVRDEEAAAHREVMAGVAHDLRTPLTALQGHLEALAQPHAGSDDRRAPPRQALLDAALGQSSKVRRLTQQLFELATLQSIDELPQREPFRLDELVSDTVQKFDPGVLGRRVTLAQPAPEPVVLEGDLHLIERALSNLIDNAMRHAGSDQPVQVSLHREGQQVQVRVSDRGTGLPADLARRLDADQPVREPRSLRPGSDFGGFGGLGLAIAQRIARLHGGRLHTLPGQGVGTMLALALPLVGAGPALAHAAATPAQR
jgi:signal transduction histidine kinase